MTTRILTIFFLLTSGLTKAQFVSTVFLDTIDITINNKRIYASNSTTIKFIPNSNDINLTVYSDGIYKLNLQFVLSKSNSYSSLVLSGVNLFCNDTIYPLAQIEFWPNYEECSEMYIASYLMQNRLYNKPEAKEKTQVKLHYRLFNFAPIDTSNYKYNYRQGLWIGKHQDAKVVTVNYENDKKNGLAKALYHNGVTYNVNFKNDIADNYGQGYWANHEDKTKMKFQYIYPSILSTCHSTTSNSYSSFYFLRKAKLKEVVRYEDLSIHFEKKGIKNDSMEYHVRGDFMSINSDSIVLHAEEMDFHDFYKKNTDSLHQYSSILPSGFAKIPINEISRIYYARDDWKTFTLRASLVSLATALIVAPLISIQKGGFNSDRFRAVSGASFGVMILSISFGVAFSQKEYLLKPTKKSNKTWTIKPGIYE